MIVAAQFIKKPRPHELPQAIAENAQRVSLTNQELTANQALKTRTFAFLWFMFCLLYTSPSPRDLSTSRMPSSA